MDGLVTTGAAGITTYNEPPTVLRHFLFDYSNCDPHGLSSDLLTVLRRAARNAGATVLTEAQAIFQPHGRTITLILAESHITLSTWPEHFFATLDVAVCGSIRDGVIDAEVEAVLKPAQRRMLVLARSPG